MCTGVSLVKPFENSKARERRQALWVSALTRCPARRPAPSCHCRTGLPSPAAPSSLRGDSCQPEQLQRRPPQSQAALDGVVAAKSEWSTVSLEEEDGV